MHICLNICTYTILIKSIEMSLYACKAGNFYGDEIIARRAILHMGMLFSDGKISIKLPKLPRSSETRRGVIMACTCVLIKICWGSF